LSVAYLLLNAASYDGKSWNADTYRPCAGQVLGFMCIGVVVTKIMTFFSKTCVQIGLDFCCGDLRWVGATVRSKRLAGCSSALGSSGPV